MSVDAVNVASSAGATVTFTIALVSLLTVSFSQPVTV